MTVKFEYRHSGEFLNVEDVTVLEPGYTLFSTTGYYVRYTDGRCNVYSQETWRLISVTQ